MTKAISNLPFKQVRLERLCPANRLISLLGFKLGEKKTPGLYFHTSFTIELS
jgi:hypothetical protein